MNPTPEWLTNLKKPIPKGIFFGIGGNRKLGTFADVIGFSRAPGLPQDGGTCPAASTEPGGCLHAAIARTKATELKAAGSMKLQFACYGFRAKIRFWLDRGLYEVNSTDAPEDPVELGAALDDAIVRSGRRRRDKTLLRLHPVGDFDTEAYVESWTTVLKPRPWVEAFGFTRSWRMRELWEAFDALRALPNVQVLASMDWAIWNKGELPPGWFRLPSGEVGPVAGAWRQAWMGTPPFEMRRHQFHCPEALAPDDPRYIPTCRACGACWIPQVKSSLQGPFFPLHP